jgi:fructokinase
MRNLSPVLVGDELGDLEPRAFSVFHCGGIVLAEEPSASAFASLADLFAENQIPVSLDPTVRQSLIYDPDQYRAFLRRMIEKVSILKLSDEELWFLTGTKDFDEGIRVLPTKEGALVFVTLGREGASVYRDGIKISHAPGFDVKAVETTGCGDCFMAAILAALAGNSIAELAPMGAAALRSSMRFANAPAAMVATRIGAGEANPTRQEVERFVAEIV